MEQAATEHWLFDQAWELLGPILVALVGYAIVHIFSSWRDRKNKKREIRVKFLINSYERLTRVVRQAPWKFEDLQQVLADIQLMGTKNQVDEAEKLSLKVPEAMKGSGADAELDLGPLLREFRNDLRAELSMKAIEKDFIWLKGAPHPGSGNER